MKRAFLPAIFLGFALSATVLAGCPAPPAGNDGGDSGGVTDSGVTPDVPDATPGPLFTQCTTNAQCGSGRTCDLNYPGGLCTRMCRRDNDCGESGWCYRSNCIPQCTAGANSCAPYSGLCFFWDSNMQDKRGCFPGCAEMPAAGQPACVGGRTCDPYSGVCQTSPTMMGAANGAPCTSTGDCAGGRCRLEYTDTPNPMTPTGYLDGYCFSVTRRPADAAFVRNMPLPRGGCPMGSVVLPVRGDVEGDSVSCWKECRQNSDCRAGYVCNRLTGTDGMPVYSTGACFPINCRTMGMTCPAGTVCNVRMSGTSTIAVCARDGDAGAGDAGSDASSEAGTDAGSDTGVADSGVDSGVDATSGADAADDSNG